MPINPSDYAQGQACVRGHVISGMVDRSPDRRSAFCPQCGAATIDACPACRTPMRGYYMSGAIGGPGWEPDAFCYGCGAAFPWTVDAKQAAAEVIDLLDGLNESERAQLKGTLEDLMTDTPTTEVAATKFKLLARKTGQEGGIALRAIVTSVATEAAKRLILGG